MKKTEKIEVRVSFEEKERLSELAGQRNQNISELIRDRMAGNYTVPAQTLSRDIIWNRGISVVALVFGLLAFLRSLLALMDDGKVNAPPVLSNVQMTEAGEFFTVLETKIAHRDGFSKSYSIQTKTATYRTTQSVIENDSVFQLTVDLCRVDGDTCVPLKSKQLILSAPSPSARQSTAVFFEEGQPVFRLSTWPQRPVAAAPGDS